jgi:sugar lactone lactonase YvrE
VLKYSPKTKKTTLVATGIQFANGITLSKKEDFLLVTETGKYRVLRIWLEGEKKGKTELFSSCPGFCDNISLSEDGKSYWVAIPVMRNRFYDFIHPLPWLKRFILSLPEEYTEQPKKGLIIRLDENGKLLESLEDSNGQYLAYLTSANEFDGKLFLGNIKTNHFGIYVLEK